MNITAYLFTRDSPLNAKSPGAIFKSSFTEFLRFDEYNDVNCGCAEPCDSVIYSGYVLNRKFCNISVPTSQIYVFYTTKMHSVSGGGGVMV